MLLDSFFLYVVCNVVHQKMFGNIMGFITKKGEGNPFLFLTHIVFYVFLACFLFFLIYLLTVEENCCYEGCFEHLSILYFLPYC